MTILSLYNRQFVLRKKNMIGIQTYTNIIKYIYTFIPPQLDVFPMLLEDRRKQNKEELDLIRIFSLSISFSYNVILGVDLCWKTSWSSSQRDVLPFPWFCGTCQSCLEKKNMHRKFNAIRNLQSSVKNRCCMCDAEHYSRLPRRWRWPWPWLRSIN